MTAVLGYRSYAKINLYLDVINRRRDGYHNIETIFQTVTLADELTFEEHAQRVSLTCSSPELDTGENNLVYRAAMLLRQRTGCRLGARIHLEKRIPIAAGLAGGSGNAAAALVALNVLWDLRISPARLRAFALELGSDVPYCLQGGTAAATLRGQELLALRPLSDEVWFVLAHPEISVSASHAYNHPFLGHSAERPFAGRTASFRRAIRMVESGEIPCMVFNRMETPVFHEHPHLAVIKARLMELGCVAAAMSGSGPTLFGVCAHRRAAARIAEMLPDVRTSVVAPAPHGVERIQ